MSSNAAVVLAAGSSSRYREAGGSTSKLLAELEGVPLVVHAVRAAVEARVGEVVVVQGAVDLASVLDAADLLSEVTLLENEDWEAGLACSLRCALDHLGRAGVDSAVVGLGDQPGLPASAWQAVTASAAPVGLATYDGRRGHPVRLHADVWPQLPVAGDRGARALVAARPDLVGEVPCDGDPTDIDTPDDLRSFADPD